MCIHLGRYLCSRFERAGARGGAYEDVVVWCLCLGPREHKAHRARMCRQAAHVGWVRGTRLQPRQRAGADASLGIWPVAAGRFSAGLQATSTCMGVSELPNTRATNVLQCGGHRCSHRAWRKAAGVAACARGCNCRGIAVGTSAKWSAKDGTTQIQGGCWPHVMYRGRSVFLALPEVALPSGCPLLPIYLACSHMHV